MLGKNPTSLQSTITLAQKKDADLCIIEGLPNHDPKHKINHISDKQYRTKIVTLDPPMVVVYHIW